MQTNTTVALSLLLSSAAAAGVSLALRSGGDGDAVATLQLAGLNAEVSALQAENAQLRARVDQLAAARARTAAPASLQRREVPTVSAEQVAVAVEAYLDQRAADGDGARGGAGGDAAQPAFDVEGDLDTLLGKSYWEDSAAWKRAFDAGRMDDVIEALAELAAAQPDDPQAQMDLANAYMAYMQMDNSKWNMSMLADQQFDKVLAIDEEHWEARFTKAVSYTFWPKFLGKNKAAIEHFETLVAQQEAMPIEAHQAQTYLYLGNLLADDDPARAQQIWQRGAQRHPDDEALRGKLGGN